MTQLRIITVCFLKLDCQVPWCSFYLNLSWCEQLNFLDAEVNSFYQIKEIIDLCFLDFFFFLHITTLFFLDVTYMYVWLHVGFFDIVLLVCQVLFVFLQYCFVLCFRWGFQILEFLLILSFKFLNFWGGYIQYFLLF